MQQRPSARLLVIDDDRRVLLFKFHHKQGPLAGQIFWATPGGGVDDGESFEEAALRELHEETGLQVQHPGPQIAQRTVTFALPTGEMVEADERYFLVQTSALPVSQANWTELEREVMADHRWWAQDEIAAAAEQIWPEDLPAMLISARVWAAAG